LPLLFEATWALLCIIASARNNERVHSVNGRICDKLRGSLKPSNIERVTLAFVFLPDAVKLDAMGRWRITPRASRSWV
jgi:hypothetical protein